MIRFKYTMSTKCSTVALSHLSTKEDIVTLYKIEEIMRCLNLADGFAEALAGYYGNTVDLVKCVSGSSPRRQSVLTDILELASKFKNDSTAVWDDQVIDLLSDILTDTW